MLPAKPLLYSLKPKRNYTPIYKKTHRIKKKKSFFLEPSLSSCRLLIALPLGVRGRKEGDSPWKTSQNFHSQGHMGTWKVKCVISDKYKKEKEAADYIIECIFMSFFHNQIKEKEHWLFIYTKKISETHIHLLQLKSILLMKQIEVSRFPPLQIH